MSILLLTATAMEGDRLASCLELAVEQEIFGRRWLFGQLQGIGAHLIETGLGAVNTAYALTRALEQISAPQIVLQVGVGGAYAQSGLHIGDLALARDDSFADLGVLTPAGWETAEGIGIPVLKGPPPLYNTFPCAASVSEGACEFLSSRVEGAIRLGPFATVQEVSGTAALGVERSRRIPGAICESMEGAAAAQICALYGIDFVQLRGISNAVEDRDRSKWDLPLACERSQTAAQVLVEGGLLGG